MTFRSFNSEPPPAQIIGKDAPPSRSVIGEFENLLHALLAMCRGLESATFRMTLRDQQTELATFCEQGSLLELLITLPECLFRLWRWNEILIIESCDPARDENLYLE